jgi:hypothetical protein
MVDRHLQDLRFLQLCRSLLLERRWHKTSEFIERVVDPITTSLFDHLTDARVTGATKVHKRRIVMVNNWRRKSFEKFCKVAKALRIKVFMQHHADDVDEKIAQDTRISNATRKWQSRDCGSARMTYPAPLLATHMLAT